jgi:hypothetical protein
MVGLGVGACDDDNPARHLDAGMSDSTVMIDAPVSALPVTVVVKLGGVGQQGVVVHFQNADSSLVATEMTDATGTASHLLNAGGYVTAIDPFPSPPVPTGVQPGPSHDIRSYAGVKPGDTLRIEEGGEVPGTSMTVTLPPQTDSNISYYDIAHTCGGTGYVAGTGSGGGTPSDIVSFYACTSADILVVAIDGNDEPVNYFFVPNQAITADGTLDYTTKTFSGFATRTYTLGDQPQGVFSLNVQQQLATTKGLLSRFRGSASGVPATAMVSFPNIPNGLGVVQIDGGTNRMHHVALDWGGLSTTTFTTDFGARMLSEASGYTFDAATHSASWTQSTGGVTPDFASVRLTGTRATQTESRDVSWQIVAPFTAGSVTFPALPAGTFDLNFSPTDTVNIYDAAFGKVPGGYDTVRPLFFTDTDPFAISAGAAGSAQFAYPTIAKVARTKRVAPVKTRLSHRTQSTR